MRYQNEDYCLDCPHFIEDGVTCSNCPFGNDNLQKTEWEDE